MEEEIIHFRQSFFISMQKKFQDKLRKIMLNFYGRNALEERQCQRWLTKFGIDNFNANDILSSGRFVEADNDQINALIIEALNINSQIV